MLGDTAGVLNVPGETFCPVPGSKLLKKAMVLSGPPTATLPPIWLSMVTAPVGTAQLVSPMSRCAVAVPDVFVFISETAEERRTATRVEFPGELDWAAAMLTTRPPTPTEPTQVPPGRAVQIGKNAPPLNETSASKSAAASGASAKNVRPTSEKASTYLRMAHPSR